MSLAIPGNKVPLYLQVAGALKQRVRAKVYPSGSALPSVRTLSREFGVSTFVVQRAVRELEEGGIVQTHHGKDMVITGPGDCEQAAILFGFIHPYVSSMGFHRDVLEYLDEAFSERSNFAVVRSSRDDPDLERRITEHLIANGVKGLILWPVNDDSNGSFFTDVARKIPVVLVDRLIAGADLPAVLLDKYACGREISETLLGKQKKQRLLVLMDNLRISSYDHIAQGIEAGANELGRLKDLTVVQLPITRVIQKINRADYSEIGAFAEYIERLLAEGGYDAVFCTQDEFVDYCFAQTELPKKFPALQLATLRANQPNERSIKYATLNCLEWFHDFGRMMTQTADLIQRWVLSRRMPKETLRLKMELRNAPDKT